MWVFPFVRVLSITLLVFGAGCSQGEKSTVNVPSPILGKQAEGVTKFSSVTVGQKPDAYLIVPPSSPDLVTNTKVQQYVNTLATKGFLKQSQGVWIQSNNRLLANYRGTIPLPAASLTKVATSLVALQTLSPDYRFVTLVGTTGSVENGVLKGDLVIQGGEDPFFVWEEAITLGNILNQLGIRRVTGNLAIAGKFYMNYQSNRVTAGNLFKLGLNSQVWTADAETQYLTMSAGTPRPQVVIEGSVQVIRSTPANMKLVVRHSSLPLAEIVKKMNSYSNNFIAEMLANSVGGAKVVAQKAAALALFPLTEIQLVNGSGLSVDNRISPRAVCAMFLAMEKYLQPHQMTVADVFPIIGQDAGVLEGRQIPALSVVKSGTLDNVSALAGAMPTQKQGAVWFVIINGGTNWQGLRTQQEVLLQSLLNQWGNVTSSPQELTPNYGKNNTSINEIVS